MPDYSFQRTLIRYAVSRCKFRRWEMRARLWVEREYLVFRFLGNAQSESLALNPNSHMNWEFHSPAPGVNANWVEPWAVVFQPLSFWLAAAQPSLFS